MFKRRPPPLTGWIDIYRLCAACGVIVGAPQEVWSEKFLMSKSSMQWCNYFRVILEQPEISRPPKHQITGVGFCDPHQPINEVPVDPNVNLHEDEGVDAAERMSVSCRCQLSYSPCVVEQTSHGLYAHAQCWELIMRLIGPLSPEQLGTLIESMRCVWTTNYPYYPYELNEHVDSSYDDIYRWCGQSFCLSVSSFSTIPDIENPQDYMSLKAAATPLMDPFKHVPKLRALINQSRNRRKYGKSTTSSMVTRQKERRISSSTTHLFPCDLPLDIRQLILDELSDSLLDIANAIDAFHWHPPANLWRRLPLDMVIELDGMRSEYDLDWRYFFVEFCRLMDSSYALSNRKRTYTVIKAVCDEFFRGQENCA